MTRGEAGGHQRSPALLTVVSPGAGKEPDGQASSRSGARSPRPIKLLNRVLPLRPLSALPDDRLLELTRAGSERAFEALAIRHRRQLLIYAERMLGAENRAEDAVQQALLQAWMALRGGVDVTQARPWLYRIVHNCAVSIIRRPRHDTVELSEQLDAAAAEPGHESRLVLAEIFARLASMPEPQRDAIVMTAIAGRSHEEAAEALGLTDGAVRGLVYRARSALRGAAAAVFPAGFWNWLGRRQSVGADVADVAGVAGAAGSAGLAAAVVKGGAIVATAGVIAGAGHGLLNTSGPPPHSSHSIAAASMTPAVGTRALNGPPRATPVGAMGISIVTHHDGGNHDRHSGGPGEGRGGSAQSGSRRESEAEHHGGGSGDGEGSRGGRGPSSNGGSGDSDTSGSSGGSGGSGGSGSSGSSGTDGRDGGSQHSSGGGSSASLDGSGKSGSDGGGGGSSGGPSVKAASASTAAPTGSSTSDGGGSTSDSRNSTGASAPDSSGSTTGGSGSTTGGSGSTSDGSGSTSDGSGSGTSGGSGSTSDGSGTSAGSGDTVSGSAGGGGS